MKLKINFTLKDVKSGESPILAYLNFGYKEFDIIKQVYVYKPIRYYIGLKIDKNAWDKVTGLPFSSSMKSQLIQIEKKIQDIFRVLEFQDELTPDSFKNELDEQLKGKTKKQSNKRIRIVEFIESDILTSDNLKVKTKSAYITLKNRLIKHETTIGIKLYANELNEEIFKDFINSYKKDVNKQNTVWSMYKTLRATLNEIRRKYKLEIFNPSMELARKDLINSVRIETIYLNFHQVQKIIDFDPKDERLKNTKFTLLTLLFTGCRYSDVNKIQPEFEYKSKDDNFYYARYVSQKTNTEIIVPFLKPLLEAYKTNGNKMAQPVSNMTMNKNLKEFIELCNMVETTTISYTDTNGIKKFEERSFYNLVTTHIGRRSFITNFINYIPITILSKITGHEINDNNIIFQYNKISLLENAVLFRKQVKRAVDENPDYFPFELV